VSETGDDRAARRRRRTPEAAQREILDAAAALLRERPFRELTVDEVMRRTDLSRPSFYVYFKDRHELVLRVVADLQDELLHVASRWLEADADSPQRLRDAITGVTEVYAQHGPMIRALADAATDDPDVEEAYGALVESFISTAGRNIASEVEAGRVAPLDPHETARALVLMTERYLYHAFGAQGERSAEAAAETLITIMSRALYQS
jgi:TetR/AcrR family transcriptional regulator, ethionamide resistance regulator